ncbi:tetratricopeptide repeat protein [Magnetospirillum sp. 15-1]|uniref:tetratricopeptide repeat protein n=1 Tax=Magnetospirillum sp. 15-1 TaxID=1979370 RepID=UPI000BBCF3F1|nr:tetratricopeptide repeat protein [Magnetospirillum sp. 15-1]
MAAIRYVTGVDSNYFHILFPLFASLAITDPGLRLHVCDYGLTEPQRAFLRRKELLLETPSDMVGVHPWRAKTALGRYVAALDWDVIVWMDADMVALAPIAGAMEVQAKALLDSGKPLAACLDPATVTQMLAMIPAPHFEAMAPAHNIFPGTHYLNSGFFACASREFLDAWERLSRGMPDEGLFDQNALNLMAHSAGFQLLTKSEWNLCAADIADARIEAGDGRPRVSHAGFTARILHATSFRSEDVTKRTVTVTAGGRVFEALIKLACHSELINWQLEMLRRGLEADAALLAECGLGSPDTGAAGDADAEAKAHFQKGGELFLTRRFEAAAEQFREVLRLKPDHPRSLYNLAMTLIELNRRTDALPLLRRAVGIDPDYREAYCNLALLLRETGAPEEAGRLVAAMAGRWPDDPAVARIVDGFQSEMQTRKELALRSRLTSALVDDLGMEVRGGPFRGQHLRPSSWWGHDGDLIAKLLGSYEEELHPAVERALARHPDVVVNVGCAEGYYAVGLALRLPAATVFAHDISEEALGLCREAADLNGVGSRLITAGACTHAILRSHLSASAQALAVIDCEGAELQLIDPDAVPELLRCDLLIECHDFVDRNITPTLIRRLSPTHEVEMIRETPRNPEKYRELARLSPHEGRLLLDEGRGVAMHWLACWAKTGT